MTPHLFECKNATEENMISKQKWPHITQDILGKHSYDLRLQPLTSAHN